METAYRVAKDATSQQSFSAQGLEPLTHRTAIRFRRDSLTGRLACIIQAASLVPFLAMEENDEVWRAGERPGGGRKRGGKENRYAISKRQDHMHSGLFVT